MRCFVAIDLSPEVRAAIVRAQAGLRAAAPQADVRWLDPTGMHLTLAFLGEVREDRVAALQSTLTAAMTPRTPLALMASGLGGFPSARRPRVVWAGIVGEGDALGRTAAAVTSALVPLGFPAEERPFSGHVTLARVRSPRGLRPLGDAIAAGAQADFGTWTARDVVLYRSHLRPSGAVYEPLGRFPFGG
jgi:RNA 2',3'-cyclic 3'-phosphodiesterase